LGHTDVRAAIVRDLGRVLSARQLLSLSAMREVNVRGSVTGSAPTMLDAKRTSILGGSSRGSALVPLAAADPRTQLVGRVLDDRYEVVGVLGEGGMGVAYEAHDRMLERPVVVKVVAPDSNDGAASDRLMREARLACRITHDAIVTVHHLGMLPTREPYLVMERLVGRDLGAIVHERGAFDLGEVTALLEPIASALEALHAGGVVHRDVKPDNIFLLDGDVRRARTKLFDFGLAMVDRDTADRLTATGRILGTAEYMAPECARGGAASPAADTYALAVTAFELLTGQLPYAGSGIEALIAKTTTPAQRLSEYRSEWWVADADRLLALALSNDPSARPTPTELVTGLRLVTETMPSAPAPVSRPVEHVPDARTTKGTTAVAWIAFFAALVSLTASVLALAR
jgi:serine/threonine-protein kinase